MSKCPHCFRDLPTDRIAYACRSGICEATADAVASAYHGAPVSVPPVTLYPPNDRRGWMPPDEAPCQHCKGVAHQCCPRCHYPLPDGWRSADVTCVAMAGARATGKSLYIAVAVKQFQLLAEHRNVTVEPADGRVWQQYTDVYEKPLFQERGIMRPTPRADTADSYQRDPLIFRLGGHDQGRQYLVIRDVAGEDVERLDGSLQHLTFFAHATGVVFLFDPLWVSDVRSQLQGLIPHQPVQGGDPRAVLTNVLSLIGTGSPRLAVTVSKFDTLQALRSVRGTDWSRVMSNAGAAFARDPGLARPYDERDGELLHQEIRSLLQRLNAGAIVAAVENPASGRRLDHRFFAVSALGESPEGERLHDRGITPYRCLDPLRWIMTAS